MGPLPPKGIHHVNGRLNRATDDRRNGATQKCSKSGFGRLSKQWFLTSFKASFIGSFTDDFGADGIGRVER